MTDVTHDQADNAMTVAGLAMGAMFDLAAPQQRYLDIMAQGGYVEVMEDVALELLAREHRVRAAASSRSSPRVSTCPSATSDR